METTRRPTDEEVKAYQAEIEAAFQGVIPPSEWNDLTRRAVEKVFGSVTYERIAKRRTRVTSSSGVGFEVNADLLVP